ncbi:MAG: dihydroneopterin aldolase [Thermoleophilia bacterium]
MQMKVRIEGLQIYAYHGVLAEEKVLGQPFLFDVVLDLEECRGCFTDEVADTIDYTEVIDVVNDLATERSYNLLERLARVIAEGLLFRFPAERVTVCVRKPRPPIPCSLEGVGVEVEVLRHGSPSDDSRA